MIQKMTYETILERSRDYSVVVQDSTHEPFDGSFFASEEDALVSIADNYPRATLAKMHVPLAAMMLGRYDLADPESSSRPNRDFRIVTTDRVLAPEQDLECAVIPYLLHYGLTSIEIKADDGQGNTPFVAATAERPFTLGILEPGTSPLERPEVKTVFPATQVVIRPEGMSADELVTRYTALRRAAGRVLERVFNDPVATF